MHPHVTGTNRSDVRAHNLGAILLLLLHSDDTSRVSLAQALGVSNATVTNLINELKRQGLVEEDGFVHSAGQVGRRQRALKLLPGARYAMGVHIDVGTVYIALTDLAGTCLDHTSFSHDLSDAPQSVLSQVADAVEHLLAEHAEKQAQIVGLGVAASGLVDWTSGVNILAPNLNWRNVPIAATLAQRLHYPLIVENNVRAMALGEALFGCATRVNAMAFIYGRVGVGAGLVVGGRLYRGADAGAGEIGHTWLTCDAGQPQALEALISEPQIVREASACAGETLTFDEIIQRVQAGDANLSIVIDRHSFYLGLAIANIVNLFNPEMIVLGGIYSQAADIMLPKVHDTVQRYAFANLGQRLTIRTTALGQDVGMVGAAALALDAFFYRSATI